MSETAAEKPAFRDALRWLTGLTLALVWGYATHDRRLVRQDLDPQAVRMGLNRILLGPALYGLSIALCF